MVTFGRLFAITRQAIINDDLSALSDIPARHGEAAARKMGDVAYAVLTANAAMGDSVALFHATHGNLGAAAVVGIAPIAEAIKLMKLQKDLVRQEAPQHPAAVLHRAGHHRGGGRGLLQLHAVLGAGGLDPAEPLRRELLHPGLRGAPR